MKGRGDKTRIASGVKELDELLEGLFIGDNVVWYDDAGSLASPFCLNFIQASQQQERPIIYVTFDRSPKNLVDKLGSLADSPWLIILDCFTYGKGAGSPIFLDFYKERKKRIGSRAVCVEEPRRPDQVMDILYGTHGTLQGDVRFVFESLTGMQELWGGEEQLIAFYSHSCPRLYELNTIAYWVLEKKAHSPRLRAQISQIAQVVIDLSVKRGTNSLTILKAEKRDLGNLNKPYPYWTRDLNVVFESQKRGVGRLKLGTRLRDLRTKRGLSQKELADLVGVTSSTISQVESNLIYPSLPALVKIAEILSVEVSSFFQEKSEATNRFVFSLTDAVDVKVPGSSDGLVVAKRVTPLDLDTKAEPYLIEIPPGDAIPAHFFIHKGEELGYLISGKLEFKMKKAVYTASSGDIISLSHEVPSLWRNPGPESARLLWIKIK
jgi:transcriptional regulator with XRE-family HTH domain/KaiC/GvpD/RAD55 family RecA-like ATPase